MQAASLHTAAWVPYVPQSEFRTTAKSSTQLPVASLRWQLYPQRSDPHLVVTRGDLTQARIDAIVNSTGGSLDNGTGIGAAIVEKGGAGIATVCQACVKKYGPLPVGQAVTTSAGALPCSYVIHVASPKVAWQSPTTQQANQLRAAVRSALDEAERLRLTSVAIPGISTGSNEYPADLAAKEIVSECVEYVRKKTTLTTIVLMDIDKSTHCCFKNALLEAAKGSGGVIQKASGPIVDFRHESTVTKLVNLFFRLLTPTEPMPFELLASNHADYKHTLAELSQDFASRVVSVRRVQIPARTMAHNQVKSSMTQVKEPLYHGTPERWCPSAITLNGFDLSIVTHGRSFGNGVYGVGLCSRKMS